MHREQMDVNIDLLKKYDRPGPRYTSYPTAPYFHNGVDANTYIRHLQNDDRQAANKELSLYFHLPFCNKLCYYCGCNMLLNRNKNRVDQYIDYLEKEIKLLKNHLSSDRKVLQMHWGGGTPTHLSPHQIRRLGTIIKSHFEFLPEAEISVELDPRELTLDHMQALQEIGFNRASMGVQDFDFQVQEAVNRIQPEDITRRAIDWARELGFVSMNIDLMYGLPFQNTKSFGHTLEKIIDINPDRLAVFNYAHLPTLIKRQKLLKADTLPGPEEKLNLLKLSIETLTAAGYVYIGMDHFAKPQDELTLAMQNGTLYRNFQGYSTHSGLNLLAFGISSIGMLSDLYVQNEKGLAPYFERLDAGQLPTMRGVEVSAEDQLRREVITELMCNFRLIKADVEHKYGISFDKHFADALKNLHVFEEDGLIVLETDRLTVTTAGRLLIRNIAMNFDAYLMQKSANQPQFSRTV